MSKVFVLDTAKRPLDPIHPGWARKLLSSGQAAVYRRYPFTIILKKEVIEPTVQPLRLKLDPGSKTTGLAVLNDATGEVVWAAELTHRGHAIKERLDGRRGVRRGRRQRHTRYRQPRFNNRRRRSGWLAPSLKSRITNILTWARRLMRLCALSAISQEVVEFDLQAMENPGISGAEYQQGTLMGYELRAYLLEKWNRRCAYCFASDVPLQVEHIQCRAHGGSNRCSNLTLACESCNRKKGTQDLRVFLQDQPEVLNRILAQAKTPLQDAAAVNTTRWALFEQLKGLGLPVECGSGGRTKYNRRTRELPKTHWIDAACVGKSTPLQLHLDGVVPLLITATGRQSRQMCGTNKYGFVRTKAKESRTSHGFQTGDMVKAFVPTGKRAGRYQGKVAIKASGYFSITTRSGTVTDIAHRYCRMIQRNDGYSYQKGGGGVSSAGF